VILGGPVVEAVSQPGGFSPGTADRVRTSRGSRAFVKAVSFAQNEHTPILHRREARITAALPPGAGAPRLLGTYDDGQWMVLVLEDIEGRHPVTPWLPGELNSVLAALKELARQLTPSPLPDAPDTVTVLAEDLAGWHRVAADPPADLDPWAAEHLSRLREVAQRGCAALVGNTLVHSDVRADNLLLSPDGAVTVVDWPWASRGPAWLDTVLLLVNVRLFGGHDAEALLAAHTAWAQADPADLTGVLAGLAGYYTDIARRPASAGLPTVRAFQRAHAHAVLPWVRERLN
jgi:aminoglycoside phosphotransferase (APT) family kinase protein